MDEQLYRRFVAGPAAAAEVTRAERVRRLRDLTVEESTAEFAALNAVWYSRKPPGDTTMSSHVRALLRIRQALTALAEYRDRPV